jgi:sugar-specific transcriptional regulator TrmB
LNFDTIYLTNAFTFNSEKALLFMHGIAREDQEDEAGLDIASGNTDLAGSLEEFGLSKYEARAYITMIGKGSLAASEIAYYANLPRTKVYQTVKKLEKKRLATVSRQKPLICSASPPEEAFAEIVSLHERRVKNMKGIVERLQKINDERQRPKGSEERRYFILDPDSALEKIKSLISQAKSSVAAQLDPWGIRLISQCRLALVKAVSNGVKVQLVASSRCLENETFFSLADGIEIRLGDVVSSIMVIDSIHVITVDGSNGRATLFSSAEVFGASQSKQFQYVWDRSVVARLLAGSDPAVASKAMRLAQATENGLSAHVLECTMSSRSDLPDGLLDVVDHKYGLDISCMDTGQILDVVDSALKISCSGGLKHDRNNNVISLQSSADSRNVLPLALILACYFKRVGNEPKLMQNSGQGFQTVHLKLARSTL